MSYFRGAVLAIAVVVGGMGQNRAQASSVGPPVQVGLMSSNSLKETSGIVSSHSMAGILWVHNDSGDSARFLAINTAGTLLAQYSLYGATATDWEDIAIGPKPGGGSYLYLGDIGDNDSIRPEIQIYRVTEPDSVAGGIFQPGEYDTARLQYPGGPRNAESLMVDPLTGDVIIVTKSPGNQVYEAPASIFDDPSQVTTLTSLGTLTVPLNKPSAADISPDGLHILIRDRSTTAYLFDRSPGETVWQALQGPAIAVTLAAEAQGEAIGWAADGSGFYTASEWNDQGPQPLYYYAFTVPEPASSALVVCGAAALGGHSLARRVNPNASRRRARRLRSRGA